MTGTLTTPAIGPEQLPTRIYDNPAAAWNRLAETLDRGGLEKAALTLERRPADLGQLHGHALGRFETQARRDALAAAPWAGRAPAPTRANKPNGYLLGSYRIATAPEPNSSRLTSLKSTRFDSPANNVGPWPASLGCTRSQAARGAPLVARAAGLRAGRSFAREDWAARLRPE